MAETHNQLLIDMLMRLSGEVAKVDGIGGTRDWLIAELSTVIAHAQDGPHERVLTLSEVRAYGDDLLSAHMSPGQIVEADDHEEPLYRWIDRAIKAVNAKHGLSDPA